jgi:hypothetical protein
LHPKPYPTLPAHFLDVTIPHLLFPHIKSQHTLFYTQLQTKTSADNDEEKKCILHVNTNLIITYEGELIGRQTDEGIVYIEDLDPKIIQWYVNCGF